MVFLALLVPGLAWADPCADLDGMPDGPVVAGLFNGDLLSAHRVCGRSEVGLFGSAYLLADTANFYGHIIASGILDGSYAVDENTAGDPVHYESDGPREVPPRDASASRITGENAAENPPKTRTRP